MLAAGCSPVALTATGRTDGSKPRTLTGASCEKLQAATTWKL
jgi:hypothetical protein